MMQKKDDLGHGLTSGIARRIKGLRKSKEMSLEKLASRTGFAPSYLSQIENLKREPPISSLARIAQALEVDVVHLITGEDAGQGTAEFTIVKPSERKTHARSSGQGGYTYESITHKKKDRLMDGYILTSKFEFPDEPVRHKGQELVFMLEGKQEMVYDNKSYIIEEGDCLYFDSDRPHYSRSLGDKRARFLVVFVKSPTAS